VLMENSFPISCRILAAQRKSRRTPYKSERPASFSAGGAHTCKDAHRRLHDYLHDEQAAETQTHECYDTRYSRIVNGAPGRQSTLSSRLHRILGAFFV
jgi:hypothetical protein